MSRTFTVYILASLSRRLYIGVTGDLLRRLHEHRTADIPSFTKRYRINRLVHFEQTIDARSAIQRETELKKWSREKKILLIEAKNPGWLDLAQDWFQSEAQRPQSRCHLDGAQRPRNFQSRPPETVE